MAAFWAGLSPGMVLSAKGLRTSAWFQRLEVSLQGQERWARPGLLQDGLTLIREVIRASAEALLPNKVTATGAGRGRFELDLTFGRRISARSHAVTWPAVTPASPSPPQRPSVAFSPLAPWGLASRPRCPWRQAQPLWGKCPEPQDELLKAGSSGCFHGHPERPTRAGGWHGNSPRKHMWTRVTLCGRASARTPPPLRVRCPVSPPSPPRLLCHQPSFPPCFLPSTESFRSSLFPATAQAPAQHLTWEGA